MEFYISLQSGQFYMINVLENQWLSVTLIMMPGFSIYLFLFIDGSPVHGLKPACHLADNPMGNEETLCQIDSAVFALCLDTLDTTDPIELSRSYLYGDTANR